MATRNFEISDGASRETLFDCLRLAAEKRTATFRFIGPFLDGNNHPACENCHVRIDSISVADGEIGEDWFVKGVATQISLTIISPNTPVSLLFNTRVGAGKICFITEG